jgi:hypothetical protein
LGEGHRFGRTTDLIVLNLYSVSLKQILRRKDNNTLGR